MDEKVPVLVTTQHRGVFFGFADRNAIGESSLSLERARNCIYWHESIGGFLGLAKTGPNSKCRIGAEAPKVHLHDITSTSECSEEAVRAWVSA